MVKLTILADFSYKEFLKKKKKGFMTEHELLP